MNCIYSRYCNKVVFFYVLVLFWVFLKISNFTFTQVLFITSIVPRYISSCSHYRVKTNPDKLCKNGTKERSHISSCSREEAAGVSAAAGGQSSRELRVQRGDTQYSADRLEDVNVLHGNVRWLIVRWWEMCRTAVAPRLRLALGEQYKNAQQCNKINVHVFMGYGYICFN